MLHSPLDFGSRNTLRNTVSRQWSRERPDARCGAPRSGAARRWTRRRWCRGCHTLYPRDLGGRHGHVRRRSPADVAGRACQIQRLGAPHPLKRDRAGPVAVRRPGCPASGPCTRTSGSPRRSTREFRAKIPQGEKFCVTVIMAEPGRGAPLHAHTTEEIFIALTGRWGIFWGTTVSTR